MNEARPLLKIYLSYLYHSFPPHMPIASSLLEISVVISIILWTSHIHQLHQYDRKVGQLPVISSPNDNLIISPKQSSLPGTSYCLPPLQSPNLSVLPAFTSPHILNSFSSVASSQLSLWQREGTALRKRALQQVTSRLCVSALFRMEKSSLLHKIGMDRRRQDIKSVQRSAWRLVNSSVLGFGLCF